MRKTLELRTFPAANGIPPTMRDRIVQLAELWAQYPERPRPSRDVDQHWDALIDTWADDHSLPLYIRKGNNNRGSVMPLPSGREFVPTDNSPAQWAFAQAVLGEKPSPEEIRRMFVEDRIPVAMALKAGEAAAARYKCTINNVVNPGSAGWKVAHIDSVGLGKRIPVSKVDESILREHFRKLMKPRNMFVIPLKYGGLGELPEFCQALRTLVRPD